MKYINYVLNTDKVSIEKYYNFLDNHFQEKAKQVSIVTKYLDLGVKVIRLQIVCENFIPKLKQYFSCSLRDNVNSYDETLYIWKDDVSSFINKQYESKHVMIAYQNQRLIKIDPENKIINAENPKEKKYYFIAEDFSYESLSQQGHLFVRLISQIVRTENSALVHSAAVGIDNNGVLICAIGGSGKTTLAVSCLLEGFQYVADDYLVLSRNNDDLYASPIYSMIALIPHIFKQMPDLKTEFMCDNYNNTKYLLNTSYYDDKLARKLPVKAIVFPNIKDIKEPTIEKTDRNRAVTQMVYSTASQMGNDDDKTYMKLLISLIKDLNFYQINLSPNLSKNVQILKQFIKGL